jgi:hypothetical protein
MGMVMAALPIVFQAVAGVSPSLASLPLGLTK